MECLNRVLRTRGLHVDAAAMGFLVSVVLVLSACGRSPGTTATPSPTPTYAEEVQEAKGILQEVLGLVDNIEFEEEDDREYFLETVSRIQAAASEIEKSLAEGVQGSIGDLEADLETARGIQDGSDRVEALVEYAVARSRAGDRAAASAILKQAVEVAVGVRVGAPNCQGCADYFRNDSLALTRIHRRTAFGTAPEEARGCSSESGIMVLEQKPARKQGAPTRCCHRTNPTVSASSLTTIAWWPMPACSCRPPWPGTWACENSSTITLTSAARRDGRTLGTRC